MAVVLLVLDIRNHDVSLEFGIGYFQQLDFTVVDFAPRELGPKTYADTACNSVLNSEGVVTFKNDVGLEADLAAEIFANRMQLFGTVQPDKVGVAQFVQRNAFAFPVFRGIGDGEVDFFGAHEGLDFGIFFRTVMGIRLDADIVQGGFFSLHKVKTQVRWRIALVLHHCIGHKRRCG